MFIKLTLKETFLGFFYFNELLLFWWNPMELNHRPEHSHSKYWIRGSRRAFTPAVLWLRLVEVCIFLSLSFVFVIGSSSLQGPQRRKPHQHHDCKANHRPQWAGECRVATCIQGFSVDYVSAGVSGPVFSPCSLSERTALLILTLMTGLFGK